VVQSDLNQIASEIGGAGWPTIPRKRLQSPSPSEPTRNQIPESMERREATTAPRLQIRTADAAHNVKLVDISY
jgi:hypothetical protein